MRAVATGARRPEFVCCPMRAIRSRTRAFLGLPAVDDEDAMKRPRAVPWLAAPVAFVVALAVLVAIGVALQAALHGRDSWQVNAPAIAGLTAILLLAPSSPTQPRARNAWGAAIVGLAVVGGGYRTSTAHHVPGTAYGAVAFLVVAGGAVAGCLAFTGLTHVTHWTASVPAGSTTDTADNADGEPGGDAPEAAAPGVVDASSAQS